MSNTDSVMVYVIYHDPDWSAPYAHANRVGVALSEQQAKDICNEDKKDKKISSFFLKKEAIKIGNEYVVKEDILKLL